MNRLAVLRRGRHRSEVIVEQTDVGPAVVHVAGFLGDDAIGVFLVLGDHQSLEKGLTGFESEAGSIQIVARVQVAHAQTDGVVSRAARIGTKVARIASKEIVPLGQTFF